MTDTRIDADPALHAKGEKRILIVTGNDVITHQIREVLEKEGHKTKFTNKERDGLKLAASGQFDMVVIDYDMKEINGLTFCSILKSAENTKSLPIAMLVNGDDDKFLDKCWKADVKGIITKNSGENEIISSVNEILSVEKPAPKKQGKIVAIDDSPIVAKLYSQILTQHDFEYKVVTNPLDALPVINEFQPDLILMDQNMPEISGVELTRKIKSHSELDNIRIIMVTSDQKKKTVIKALEAGAVDFLTKPFDEEVLLARMQVHLNNKKLFDDLGQAYNQLEILKNKLELLSVTDGLTELYNHRFCYEALSNKTSEAKRHGYRLSLAVMDVDFFKKFNDTYGHMVGDKVLRSVADQISSAKRQEDIAARYGGEEFAVILPGIGKDDAAIVAERIRSRIEDTKVDNDGEKLSVTISIGVAEWTTDLSADKLIEKADNALYVSKDKGRNRVTIA